MTIKRNPLSSGRFQTTTSHNGNWLAAAFASALIPWTLSACNPAVVGDDSGAAGRAGASATASMAGNANDAKGGAANTGAAAGTTSVVTAGGAATIAGAPSVGGASNIAGAPSVGGASNIAGAPSVGGASNIAGAPGAGGTASNGGAGNLGGSSSSSTSTTTCGGLLGTSCGAGQYCKYAATAQCGAADQTGVCSPIPQACTKEYVPVCGCDGKTYGNACSAASAGISVASNGECATTTNCGGITGKACAKGQFCSYAIDAMCGAADQMGTCTTMPEACTEQYQPVCGCDGKTYGNACAAASAGISVATTGECASQPSTGASCGGLTGKGCAKGQFCNYPIAAACGAFDMTGTCTNAPQACDMMYAPVCGCDGKTYSNSCMAEVAQVSVQASGACATN